MTPFEQSDLFLAATLRDERPDWPAGWNSADDEQRLIERAEYHGVVAMLVRRSDGWPLDVRGKLRSLAIGRASWELRHRPILEGLLGALVAEDVASVLLKGTALAYSAYREPSDRSRGDTDLLVRPEDVEAARAILRDLGFTLDEPAGTDGSRLQEVWSLEAAGYWHRIDLHWAAFNTRYLDQLVTVEECFANCKPLPRLHEGAKRLSGPHFLLHVCIHRNLHRTAPYFSGGKANYGADRLIWAKDIALLTGQFAPAEWSEFVSLAKSKRVAEVMTDALRFAQSAVGASIPEQVLTNLAAATATEPRSDYLLKASRKSRALTNLLAVPNGMGRFRHFRNALAPPDAVLRARYPDWPKAPRIFLLGRRLLDFTLNR